jgi:hypothetical protein
MRRIVQDLLRAHSLLYPQPIFNMTSAHEEQKALLSAKSYQSIKVKYPEDDASFIINDEAITHATSRRNRLVFLALGATVLVTAASYGRVNEYSDEHSKPALDPLVDETFLTPTDPFVGGDESLLFPSSEKSAPFPNVALEEQCFNPAGVAVGPKGLQNIRPRNTFVGTIFERRGNECPCSFVSFSSSLP